MNERVAIVAVLSWAGAWGARSSWQDEDYYAKEGVRIAFLHDGPITPLARGTPTTILFDKSGKPVAWKVGACDWTSREIRALLEALMN